MYTPLSCMLAASVGSWPAKCGRYPRREPWAATIGLRRRRTQRRHPGARDHCTHARQGRCSPPASHRGPGPQRPSRASTGASFRPEPAWAGRGARSVPGSHRSEPESKHRHALRFAPRYRPVEQHAQRHTCTRMCAQAMAPRAIRPTAHEQTSSHHDA